MSRYLTPLPPKAENVAPGDIVGGLIYVMDKPLGIEDGMVGISLDSSDYRNFIREQLHLFQSKKQPNKTMQDRFKAFIKQNTNFNSLTEEEQIDLLLNDKKHKKGPSSKQPLLNVGLGGLLFKAYCDSLGVQEKDNLFAKIQKLSQKPDKSKRNDVYMVKQDSYLFLGRTGPSKKRINAAMRREWAGLIKPANLLLSLGFSGVAYGVLGAVWKLLSMKANTPKSAASDAVVESVSTKIATIRGIASQGIEVIEGKFKEDPNTPKIMTVVEWSTGFQDLSGRLRGAQEGFDGNYVIKMKNGFPVKCDKEGTLFECQKDKEGKPTYYKIDSTGNPLPVPAKAYDAAQFISDDSIRGLGEALINFTSMGDRDKVGKQGQNMGIMPLQTPDRHYQYQFFGIDYGKSYESENDRIKTIRDDFTFDNPTSGREAFANYSIMSDTPLTDKMKGVYILGALRGKITDLQKEEIAKQYEAMGDTQFAIRLRSYPQALAHDYLQKTAYGKEIQLDPNAIKENGDLWLIKLEELRYRQLADQSKNKKQKTLYLGIAERLKNTFTHAYQNDQIILETFKDRITLTPKQIQVLDNLEKLTALKASTLSPDGKVRLNHIRVENPFRSPWQIHQAPNHQFHLICQLKDKSHIEHVLDQLKKVKNADLNNILMRAHLKAEGQIVIQNVSPEECETLYQHLTEKVAAKTQAVHLLKPAEDKLKSEAAEPISPPAQPQVQFQAQAPAPAPAPAQAPAQPQPQAHVQSSVQAPAKPPAQPPTDKRESLDQTAFPPVTYSRASTALPPLATSEIVSAQNVSLDQVNDYLNQNKATLAIRKIASYSTTEKTQGLKLSFNTSGPSQKPSKAYIEKKSENSILFSMNKSEPLDKASEVIFKVCQIAVFSAEKNAEFKIPEQLSPQKRLWIQKGLEEAINAAKRQGRYEDYKDNEMPKIVMPKKDLTQKPFSPLSGA